MTTYLKKITCTQYNIFIFTGLAQISFICQPCTNSSNQDQLVLQDLQASSTRTESSHAPSSSNSAHQPMDESSAQDQQDLQILRELQSSNSMDIDIDTSDADNNIPQPPLSPTHEQPSLPANPDQDIAMDTQDVDVDIPQPPLSPIHDTPSPPASPDQDSTRDSLGLSQADLPSFQDPVQHDESSFLQDTVQDQSMEADEAPEWQLIDTGSQKGKQKLIHHSRWSFVMKQTRATVRYWRCSVRSSKCPALVSERDGVFTAGSAQHNHQPIAGIDFSTKLSTTAKNKGKEKVFDSAMSIIEDILLQESQENQVGIPNPDNLARQVNYARQKQRPANPTSLDFELDNDFIPNNFLRADLWTGNHTCVI